MRISKVRSCPLPRPLPHRLAQPAHGQVYFYPTENQYLVHETLIATTTTMNMSTSSALQSMLPSISSYLLNGSSDAMLPCCSTTLYYRVDFSEQVEIILADTKAKSMFNSFDSHPVYSPSSVAALDKLHAKHVLPGFSDRSMEEREIDALTTDITRDFRQCQILIQKIGLPTHAFPPSQTSTQARTESLAAKNVQRGLAAKVQDLSATFRKKQRVYMESTFFLLYLRKIHQ